MNFPSREQVQQIREQYPKGTRVELLHMTDPYNRSLHPGSLGTVDFVDDVGTVFVNWDCGSGLGVVIGEDEVRIIGKAGEPDD